MFLKRGDLISSRKHDPKFLLPRNFRKMEWFRPPGYDVTLRDVYGEHLGVYRLNRKLNLLNLGKASTRKAIAKHSGLSARDLDPNSQYGGHVGNEKVHRAILRSDFFKVYDGTIMMPSLIDPELRDDLEGAEEVVLFTDRVKGALTHLTIVDE
jgi:hypothetical protein